jgi:hypothetical protein
MAASEHHGDTADGRQRDEYGEDEWQVACRRRFVRRRLRTGQAEAIGGVG